jgi:hypothetical protein
MVNAFCMKIKKAAEEVLEGETDEIAFKKFCANAKLKILPFAIVINRDS